MLYHVWICIWFLSTSEDVIYAMSELIYNEYIKNKQICLGKTKLVLKFSKQNFFQRKTDLPLLFLQKYNLANNKKMVRNGFSFMGYDKVITWMKVLSHEWEYIWFLSQWKSRVLYPRSCKKLWYNFLKYISFLFESANVVSNWINWY